MTQQGVLCRPYCVSGLCTQIFTCPNYVQNGTRPCLLKEQRAQSQVLLNTETVLLIPLRWTDRTSVSFFQAVSQRVRCVLFMNSWKDSSADAAPRSVHECSLK